MTNLERLGEVEMTQCDICEQAIVKAGEETKLYEDAFCYILEGSRTNYKDVEYTARFCLCIKEHVADPPMQVQREATEVLIILSGSKYQVFDGMRCSLKRQ